MAYDPMGGGEFSDVEAAGDVQRAVPDGTWQPEAWSKTPEQMQAEAKAMNIACFAHAAAHGGKHSNPPAPPSWQRPL